MARLTCVVPGFRDKFWQALSSAPSESRLKVCQQLHDSMHKCFSISYYEKKKAFPSASRFILDVS